MKSSFNTTQFILFFIIITAVSAKFTAESCSVSSEACIEPGDIVPCNGHGDCVCGKCECTSSLARHYGRFCENCATCPGRCEELKDCIQCRVHHTGEFEYEEACENECVKFFHPELVDEAGSDAEYDEKYCGFTDHSDGCRFYFVYGYDNLGKLYIRAQRTKDCPPEPPTHIFGFSSGVAKLGGTKIWIIIVFCSLFFL